MRYFTVVRDDNDALPEMAPPPSPKYLAKLFTRAEGPSFAYTFSHQLSDITIAWETYCSNQHGMATSRLV